MDESDDQTWKTWSKLVLYQLEKREADSRQNAKDIMELRLQVQRDSVIISLGMTIAIQLAIYFITH